MGDVAGLIGSLVAGGAVGFAEGSLDALRREADQAREDSLKQMERDYQLEKIDREQDRQDSRLDKEYQYKTDLEKYKHDNKPKKENNMSVSEAVSLYKAQYVDEMGNKKEGAPEPQDFVKQMTGKGINLPALPTVPGTKDEVPGDNKQKQKSNWQSGMDTLSNEWAKSGFIGGTLNALGIGGGNDDNVASNTIAEVEAGDTAGQSSEGMGKFLDLFENAETEGQQQEILKAVAESDLPVEDKREFARRARAIAEELDIRQPQPIRSSSMEAPLGEAENINQVLGRTPNKNLAGKEHLQGGMEIQDILDLFRKGKEGNRSSSMIG